MKRANVSEDTAGLAHLTQPVVFGERNQASCGCEVVPCGDSGHVVVRCLIAVRGAGCHHVLDSIVTLKRTG